MDRAVGSAGADGCKLLVFFAESRRNFFTTAAYRRSGSGVFREKLWYAFYNLVVRNFIRRSAFSTCFWRGASGVCYKIYSFGLGLRHDFPAPDFARPERF